MEKEYRILITNGGSTSTKIAVRENHEVLLSVSVKHTTKELEQYQTSGISMITENRLF